MATSWEDGNQNASAAVDEGKFRKESLAFYDANGFRDVEGLSKEEQLHRWIRVFLGLSIPRVQVCSGHSAPFSFVSDMFFGKHRNSLAFANRSGGKTTDFAVLNFLDAWFNKSCEIVQIGAILEQAKKCYKYSQDFLREKLLAARCVKNLESETQFDNGSVIEIHSGTIAGVNSSHPQKANADEIELMNWDLLQQFFSMAKSKGETLAQNRLTSTRKYLSGTMQKMLNMIDKGEVDFQVYRWCIWESIEKCNPERSCQDCALFQKIASFDPKLEVGCQGKAKKSDGFYSIDDAIDKVKTLDDETWETEWLNLKPGRKGLVFKIFNRDVHVANAPIAYDANLPLYRCFDWGYVAPFICLWIQGNVEEVRVIDEYCMRQRLITANAKAMLEQEAAMGYYKKALLNFGDHFGYGAREATGVIKEKTGLDVIGPTEDLREDWIRVIRLYLKLNPDLGKARIIISPACHNLIWEMESGFKYSANSDEEYSDRPVKEEAVKANDHSCAALGYGLLNIESGTAGARRTASSAPKKDEGGMADNERQEPKLPRGMKVPEIGGYQGDPF